MNVFRMLTATVTSGIYVLCVVKTPATVIDIASRTTAKDDTALHTAIVAARGNAV